MPKDNNLSSALEHFSFSRLPQRERVARIVYAIADQYNPTYTKEDYLIFADKLAESIANGFSKPYEAPAPSEESVAEAAVEPAEA